MFNPKYTHYGSDGMGRDSYILKHNGGLWNEAIRPFYESGMYHNYLKILKIKLIITDE